MILAHVLDAWTHTGDRGTIAFRNLTILGGLAAPLFLWLAGLVLALVAERTAERHGRRRAGTHAIVRRGLEIFILAFLFRLQAFVLTPGGPLVAIFRVDILNVMGPAIVGAGILWGAARSTRRAALTCGAAAAVIALSTPVVRTAALVDNLPVWVQWYLRPSGDLTTFTLFPWAGFVFAGASAGSILSLVRDRLVERQVMIGFAAAGAALVAAGWLTAALPAMYTTSGFWTSSPTYFAIRLGIVMLVLTVIFAGTGGIHEPRGFLALEQLGRHSLFIYWIHVELVYGYLTWPLHAKLSVWGSLTSYVLFSGVMYGALRMRQKAGLRRTVQLPHNRADDRILHA